MNWLRQLVSRRQLCRDLSEEIQAHLDEKIEEFVADGMSRQEARHAALREFGNPALLEENSRDVWAWQSIENFHLDIRYGLRALRHNPVFTVVALLTISIGIAANVAVFTVVNSVLPGSDRQRRRVTVDRHGDDWRGPADCVRECD